ncbi:hypothetical protein M422DRAFT_179594, partial [Sphaerobolus stellatus SS14]
APLKTLAQSLELPVYDTPPKSVGMKTWEVFHLHRVFTRPVPSPFLESSQNPNNILITASIGRILPTRILDYFAPTRRLNVHPSLLPEYRGPSPIQHAIADGRPETGVSVMSLVPYKCGIDSGEVWASAAVLVPPGVKFATLRDILADKGGELLVSTLRNMLAGTATAVAQDQEKATRAPLIYRTNAMVQWETWDANHVDSVYRAISHQFSIVTALPYAAPYSTLQLHELAVRSPPASLHPQLQQPGDAIFDRETKSLIIRCAGNSEISVTRVQQEMKREIMARDFWNAMRPERLENGVLKLTSLRPPVQE